VARDDSLADDAVARLEVADTLLTSLRKTGFYRQFTKFLFNTTGAINGYDQFGHFLRAVLPVNQACTFLNEQEASCDAHFNISPAAAQAQAAAQRARLKQARTLTNAAVSDPGAYSRMLEGLAAAAGGGAQTGVSTGGTGLPLDAQGDTAGGSPQVGTGGSSGTVRSHPPSLAAARALLATLIGPQQPSTSGGRP